MSDRARNDAATSTFERSVTSYPARRNYRPGVVYPPHVPGVVGAIDVHCHGHEGQQDPLTLAQLASENSMGGLLFKTIGPISGEYRPARVLRALQEQLARWSDQAKIAPTGTWAGYSVTADNRAPSIERLKAQLCEGIVAVWMPIFNHANSYYRVGAREIWLDPKADPNGHTPPMAWEEALKHGHYMLDEAGKLKPVYEDIVRVVADHGASLFFGHATHPEIWALAELVDKLGYRRAVIDHPFSPFIDLSVEQMKQLASAGIYLNFTYDELSPLLGVDPKKMYEAIRAVGVHHVMLSSDAGEPLFPNSVECMRLIRGYMEAFGLSALELATVCNDNPAKIVGIAA